MATTCIAISLGMLNKLQASGISSKDPPATPEAPVAAMVATTLSNKAEPKSTGIPKVWAAAKVNTLMVMAAPAILIVAPRGRVTE